MEDYFNLVLNSINFVYNHSILDHNNHGRFVRIMNECVNKTLVVAALDLAAFHFENVGDNSRPKLIGVSGRDYQILNILSIKMAFNYVIVTPPDKQWGSCNATSGYCGGLIGMVARNEADIAISTITPTAQRAKYVDFSYPYHQDEVTFATRQIDIYEEVNSSFFTKPMDRQVWIIIGAILAILISIIKVLEMRQLLGTNVIKIRTIVAIILRQNAYLEPAKTQSSGLTVLMVIVVFAGCTAKIYECMLTSATSIARVSQPIDTMQDMVDAIRKDNYVISPSEGSSYQENILSSKIEYLKIFASSTLNNSFVAPTTQREGLERAMVQNYATVGAREFLKKTVLDMKLPLATFHYATEYLFMDQNSVAFNKMFPCKDAVNKWLNILGASGLLKKWLIDDLNPNNNRTDIVQKMQIKYIVLSDFKLVFVIFVLGCCLGIITLITEKVTTFWSSKTTKQ